MMRPAPWRHLDKWRVVFGDMASPLGATFGAFRIPAPFGALKLTVIASDGDHQAAGLPSEYAWEHVSASLPGRCPNWAEMSFIKDLFWNADETVMQLHVPKSDHRNLHPNCLHLWKPVGVEIPRPPSDTVA
jgi:hypothetical protein